MKAIAAIAVGVLGVGTAQAQLEITEVFTGLSGEDGTLDWIEVTNYGAVTVDTGSFLYDDDGPNLGDAGLLDSISLAPGASAVFLIGDAFSEAADFDTWGTDAVGEFNSIWGYAGLIGFTNGGGGLGQSSDSANLLDGGGAVLSTLAYGAGGQLETNVRYPGEATKLSSLSDGFSWSSNGFFNDNLGLPGDEAVLIGSPGAIPTPGSVALLGAAGLAGVRRRRA